MRGGPLPERAWPGELQGLHIRSIRAQHRIAVMLFVYCWLQSEQAGIHRLHAVQVSSDIIEIERRELLALRRRLVQALVHERVRGVHR